MQLNDLRPAEGSTKNRKRLGRGNSSGQGTTAGRGYKGQLSRSGGGKGKGFEGGQQPLAMRLPKLPGFTNHSRVEYAPPVKVLGDGELTKSLTVRVDKVSASAQAKIEAAGGKVEAAC